MNNSRPQQYGTQWIQKEGKYTLYLTEDRENLNFRRDSVGLGTIEEYRQLLKEVYQLTDEDFWL